MPEIETSDGLALHYETWGERSAPPVVLLHGYTASHRMWLRQVQFFEEEYFLVAPDLRGHGDSGAPADTESYTIERYAEDVRELLDALGIDLCAMAGCSFGGMIALQFGVTWPERLACLVVSDASPAYDRPDYDERFRAREAAMRENEVLARKLGMAGLGKRLAAGLSDPFNAEGLRTHYARLDLDGFLGAANARRTRPDVTSLLGERLTMPVLLCDGEDDPVFCALGVMARELPGARVVAFAEAGHGLPAQRPEAFNEVVAAFLADVESGAPIGQRLRV